MPKSTLVKPENIYADVETRAWVAKQDWKAKFAKLPAARRALFEELARARVSNKKKPAATSPPKASNKKKPPLAKVPNKKKPPATKAPKKKKPTEPKVPTARALFIERYKKECMDQGLSAADAKKKLGTDWTTLSEKQRIRYEKRALMLKEATLKADKP